MQNFLDHNVAGTGKTMRKEFLILMIFSIVILLYSFIIGMLLWGLIAVLQVAILGVLIYRKFRNKREKHQDHSKRPVGITLIAVLYAITVFSEILDLILLAYIFGKADYFKNKSWIYGRYG